MQKKKSRRAQRTCSNVPLDLYDPQGHAIIGEGRFINVSLTGSLLESKQPLHVKQSIRLQVQSPSRSPLELLGKVVWRKKRESVFNYGIRFRPSPMPA